MDNSQARDDVAVFVDFENVYVSVREKFDATPNFELIMDRCEDYGRIILARAYADWYRYPRVTSALFANGVEPMYVPTYYYDREVGRTGRPIKNSVDIHLCIDVMRTLYTQAHIDKFVLVTGDRDFIPLVNAVRQHGKEVIVIGIGGAASAHLAQSADEFLFYEQIAGLKDQQRQQEQRDRSERRERKDDQREKVDGKNGKDGRDGKRERKEEQRPQAEQPATKDVYDTLVDAIQLARQRGFVSNLGSLKVLMRELDSTFNETKLKDANGKPFAKFKEFVEEAQRLGKVQIFTNGTVTEVFLPGEDPYRLSQFAEDLSRRNEQESEAESAADAIEGNGATQTTDTAEGNGAASVEPHLDELLMEAAASTEEEPIIFEPAPLADQVGEIVEPVAAEQEPTFEEGDWGVLLSAMSQFSGPVRFIEIFGALRGARNQELVGLTNNELKDLVKQAINRGLLQRTGRGAKAYYRLSAKARAMLVEQQAAQGTTATERVDTEQPSQSVVEAEPEQDESEKGGEQRTGKPRRRRRGRARETAPAMATATPILESETPQTEPSAEGEQQVVTELTEVPAADQEAQPEGSLEEPAPELQGAMETFLGEAAPDAPEAAFEPLQTETVAEQGDTVVEQPPLEIEAPSAESEQDQATAEAATSDAAPAEVPASEEAEAVEQPARRNRRPRRRKPAQTGEQPAAEAQAEQPTEDGATSAQAASGDTDSPEEAAPKKRRPRRKKAE